MEHDKKLLDSFGMCHLVRGSRGGNNLLASPSMTRWTTSFTAIFIALAKIFLLVGFKTDRHNSDYARDMLRISFGHDSW